MPANQQLEQRILAHLQAIYHECTPNKPLTELSRELLEIMQLEECQFSPHPHSNQWNQHDAIIITYGDSITREGEAPLCTLHNFLHKELKSFISGVHILPFFPYSSDDGFAVMDFSSVNPALGEWKNIRAIAQDFKLMSDLVINHCSSKSLWFDQFIKQQGPGKDFFFTASPDDDLSQVVRPRTSPLLRKTETADGTRHVWCTFSHDQVDFDFRNPDVLKAFAGIIRLYLDQGVRIFRLDAIAFLWKKAGSSSLNLPETHEIVRLLRTLIEHARPDAIIITETNIPNQENLSYFGNANEAHCIYNFALPPLLVNTLVTGSSRYLKQWLMGMPPAQHGTTYFNFIASHDGIGLRPVEGILAEQEAATLIETMQQFGGRISWRNLDEGKPDGGKQKPYEINISLYDALQGTTNGPDQWNMERFICAHAIMLGLEGIPGLYIHSLLATGNDYRKLENSGHNRAINRHRWDSIQLEQQLENSDSQHHKVFQGLKNLLAIRRKQPAFHPNATQFTLHLGDQLFGFWRQSMDRQQSIFCISNISDQNSVLKLADINLIGTNQWTDLISGQPFYDHRENITLAAYQTLWITNL